MTDLLPEKLVKWSPVIHTLILLCGTIMSFSIALAHGDVNAYLPFISETGAFSPAMGVFSLFVIIASFTGFIMIYFRFCIMSVTGPMENRLFSLLNSASCIVGLFQMFGMAGVAAYPMSTIYAIHLLAAAVYFISTMLYFLCVTYTSYQDKGLSKLVKFRSGLTISLILMLFLLVICFPLAQKIWKDHNSSITALKTPENKGFTLLLISSILEWSIMGVIILFTLSMCSDLRQQKLLIHVAPMTSKEVSIIQEPPNENENL